MSTTPSLLALLAVLTLAMLAGCKTGEADDEPAPVAQGETPEGEPGRRPQAGDDVQGQKLEVLVQGFLDNARAALAEGNLEAAHEALSHAFEIDPSNPEVQTLLESVSIRMGQREGTVGALARDAEDLNRVRRMFKTFHDKARLVSLLNQCLLGGGVRVIIGEDSDLTSELGFSLVAKTYGVGDRTLGTLGICGPSRMEYQKIIPLVDFLGETLSRALAESFSGPEIR